MSKQAIIFGATGAVGRQLLDLCLNGDIYQKVTVIARRPTSLSHAKLNWIVAEMNVLEDLPPNSGLGDGDAFCCLGTTIKAAGSKKAFRLVDYDYVINSVRFAKKCGIKTFSMISVVGADAKSNSFYNRTKAEVEVAVIAEKIPSLRIFRPSLLKGKRDDFRPMEVIGNIASLLLTPLFFFGFRKYQPVEIEKLARALYKTANEGNVDTVRIYESSELQSY
ncbi:NAD(P)H-binding protein [Maridesulfovibrio frigidus]|uniref:NAD(P)H-binding protein n=1 Tax=Maridesulfovibrio frigidus TaxID=340956 RepID=UPI0004E0BA23|nr:NAD(P)H-binding protein [Maridesulfovibrio frigidus]